MLWSQRNSHLDSCSCINRWCRRRNIWIYSSLIKVQFDIDTIADVIIQCWTDRNFLASVRCKSAVLIQNTVGSNIVPDSEAHLEIYFII